MTVEHDSNSQMESMALALKEHVGVYYDDIYLSTVKAFPKLEIIKSTQIQIMPNSSLLAAGVDDDGRPMVHLGKQQSVTQRIRNRLVRRLELPGTPTADNDEIFMRIIFAHEIGHILQHDLNFESTFGEIDYTIYKPEDDYSIYYNSDKELNADYIAAKIVSLSKFGQALGVPDPVFPPREWRLWAANRG